MDIWKKHLEREWNVFDTYMVRLCIKQIVGGKPATADMIAVWVDATNKEKSEEERQRIKDAHIDTLPEVTDEKAEKQSCVFPRVDGQLCIEGRQVKAMIKEVANIIKDVCPTGRKAKRTKAQIKAGTEAKEEVGIANLKSKVAERVFVMEDYISLDRTEPDERLERPIHVVTAQGPRTSIKRVEIVNDAEITFTMKRKKGSTKSDVPEAALMAIFDYARLNGLGADRSQSYGQFEVLSVEKIEG